MMHQESVRIVPGAKTAVLFIHGICSTPDNFRDMIPLESMVPQDWSVYNLLLPGHGGAVSDFGRSSMEKWKAYAWEKFEQLADNHEKIILVGHSMGTLFSIQMALERPEAVQQLFLLAVPLRAGVKPIGVVNLLRLTFDRSNPQDPVQMGIKGMCGVGTTKMLWKYIPWIPRAVELLREMHGTAKIVGGIAVPCVVYQSEHDEMVSKRSCEILKKNQRLEVYTLPSSTHYYYAPEDTATVQQRFQQLIETAGS